MEKVGIALLVLSVIVAAAIIAPTFLSSGGKRDIDPEKTKKTEIEKGPNTLLIALGGAGVLALAAIIFLVKEPAGNFLSHLSLPDLSPHTDKAAAESHVCTKPGYQEIFKRGKTVWIPAPTWCTVNTDIPTEKIASSIVMGCKDQAWNLHTVWDAKCEESSRAVSYTLRADQPEESLAVWVSFTTARSK